MQTSSPISEAFRVRRKRLLPGLNPCSSAYSGVAATRLYAVFIRGLIEQIWLRLRLRCSRDMRKEIEQT